KVQAVDPTTGNRLSTTATTDANGSYALRLVAALPPKVRMVATPPDGAGLPTLMLDVDTHTLVAPINTLTVDLTAPKGKTATATNFKFHGFSSSGADMAVSGATCSFVADVSDPSDPSGIVAVYRASGVTDMDGNVSTLLVPTPDAGSPYTI